MTDALSAVDAPTGKKKKSSKRRAVAQDDPTTPDPAQDSTLNQQAQKGTPSAIFQLPEKISRLTHPWFSLVIRLPVGSSTRLMEVQQGKSKVAVKEFFQCRSGMRLRAMTEQYGRHRKRQT